MTRRFAVRMLTSTALACSLMAVSLAAQGPRQLPADAADARLTARHGSSVMQVHLDEASASPQFDEIAVPPNLVVATSFRPTFEAMLRDSPTFRRQCARLANASSLTITVIVAANIREEAVTDFSADGHGRTLARVQLGQRVDREELIAHEFEHIIEQLDGVDLPTLARSTNAGVRFTEDANRFETERAIAIGRQVAQEIRAARRKHM